MLPAKKIKVKHLPVFSQQIEQSGQPNIATENTRIKSSFSIAVFKGTKMDMQSTGLIGGWGTLSLINAGLAQSKGRSGLIWWLISLFIGPIATLLIVILPAARSLSSF
jgi:hypothetical protein